MKHIARIEQCCILKQWHVYLKLTCRHMYRTHLKKIYQIYLLTHKKNKQNKYIFCPPVFEPATRFFPTCRSNQSATLIVQDKFIKSLHFFQLQWWFVNPDTFVPGRYCWINEFSGLLNRLSVQKRKSVPTLFVRISEISGLSEPGLTNHHCIN